MMVFILLLFHSMDSLGARYRCIPTFGESVPLGLAHLKEQSGLPLQYGQMLPGAFIWNAGVEKRSGQSSKPKRRLIKGEDGFYYLDTRYMVQQAAPFFLSLSCPKNSQPCDLRLEGGEKLQFSPVTLFDQRDPSCKGEASFQTTKRGAAGILGRLWKKCADGAKTLSGSGEMKLFSESKEFSFDFGIDEQIALGSKTFERNAALELKVECGLTPLE